MVAFYFQIQYSVDGNQIRFLQMFSAKGWQNITYHCRNSVAWNDENNSKTNSIKLRGDNGMEYHALSAKKFRPKVIKDDCNVSVEPIISSISKFLNTNNTRNTISLSHTMRPY
jgi:hypothetical protein